MTNPTNQPTSPPVSSSKFMLISWCYNSGKPLVGDFNGDGKDDLWCNDASTGVNRILISSGYSFISISSAIENDGKLNIGSNSYWCASPQASLVGDFNGDGKSDLWCRGTGGQEYFFLSTGSNFTSISSDSSGQISFGYGTWIGSTDIAGTGDINGDGKSDLWSNSFTNSNFIMLSTGVSFTSISSIGDGTIIIGSNSNGWCGVRELAGDFNGDGKADLWCNDNSNGRNYFMLSTGSNFISINSSSIEGYLNIGNSSVGWCSSSQIPLVGDFNGDGKDDLWCNDNGNGNNYFMLSTGTSFTHINSLIGDNLNGLLNIASYSNWCYGTLSTPLVGDFNGDGKADLWCNTNGTNSFMISNGSIFLETFSLANAPTFQPMNHPSMQPTFQPSVFLLSTLKNDLVAYYPFDGNANDESGNGNDGVVHSATLVPDRYGNANSAYSFDGSSSYIEINNGSPFDFINSFSVSLWIKPATNQLYQAIIIEKSHDSSSTGPTAWSLEQVYSSPNDYRFLYRSIDNSWEPSVTSGTQLLANQWNHYVGTKKNTKVTSYLNGNLVSTLNGTFATIKTNANLPLFIGSDYGITRFFNGAIDDIFIYNRTLSAEEVKLLYNFETPTSQPSSQPSRQPSHHPSYQPSKQPTSHPTIYPKYIGKSIDLATLTNYQGVTILGGAANDYSGYSVSGAGDVNGDGFDDIIIGAFDASPNSRYRAGESYVIYGSGSPGTIDLSLALSQGFIILGGAANDGSGFSVSRAGDVNGDGYADIIFGTRIRD